MKFVESKYRSRWKGVIIDEKPHKYKIRNKKYDIKLYMVLILFTPSGHIQRKRIIRRTNSLWCKEIEQLDVSGINPDWFKNLPSFSTKNKYNYKRDSVSLDETNLKKDEKNNTS